MDTETNQPAGSKPGSKDTDYSAFAYADSIIKNLHTRLEDASMVFNGPRSFMIGVCCLPVFAAIHYAAYWLRFDTIDDRRWVQLIYTMSAVLIIKSFLFAHYKIYQGWSRYATFYDLVALAQASSASAVCLAVVDYLFLADWHTPRAVFIMDWAATVVVIGGLRSMHRWVEEAKLLFNSKDLARVLIIGADDTGENVLRAIRHGKNDRYHVVGFVAEKDSPERFIGGVPVVGSIDDTVELAKQFNATELLIASGTISGKLVRRIVEDASEHSIEVKVLPSFDQLFDGRVDMRPRTVSIEDLLRRDPVELDTDYVSEWLEGKTVLVTGSAGSIGSEMCRQILPFGPGHLVVVDRSENGLFFLEKELRATFPDAKITVCVADIGDRIRMADVIRGHKPNVIFHAAAYKHVPLMEMNCSEAIKNIPVATKNIADLADKHGVESFVMISTDKAVNPTSVMGCSKRVAEIYVQALANQSDCRFVTVRFGNVLGSNGSVVPIFAKQIEDGGPVTVTHPDMQRYFMMIPEASQLVIQAGAMGKGGEIFVLDMGEPVKIVDLARDMVRLSGLREGEDIEIKFSGVRPGEKLFEELHIHGEQHVATSHPKIVVAKCQQTALQEITQAIQRLHLASSRSNDDIVMELQRIVPEFVPTRFGQPTAIPERRRAA